MYRDARAGQEDRPHSEALDRMESARIRKLLKAALAPARAPETLRLILPATVCLYFQDAAAAADSKSRPAVSGSPAANMERSKDVLKKGTSEA